MNHFSLFIHLLPLDYKAYIPTGWRFFSFASWLSFFTAIVSFVLTDTVNCEAGFKFFVSQFTAVERVFGNSIEIGRDKVHKDIGALTPPL